VLFGALLIATANRPNGTVLVVIGSVLLAISVFEILFSKRKFRYATSAAIGWAGRCFAIAVWVLMIVSGISYLRR
jgi:hypothetical protein